MRTLWLTAAGASAAVTLLALTSGGAHVPASVQPSISPDLVGERSVMGTRSARVPARTSRVDPAAAAPTARRDHVRVLAALLDGVVFDRESWERAGSALAAELSRRELDEIESSLGSGDDARTLAAATLLRRAGRHSLPVSSLRTLRTAWLAPVEDPRCAAAARSLAAAGTPSDLAALLAELGEEDDRRRSLALWALEAAEPSRLANELVARLAWAEGPATGAQCAALRAALARARLQQRELEPAALELARDRMTTLAVDASGTALSARARAVLDELDELDR